MLIYLLYNDELARISRFQIKYTMKTFEFIKKLPFGLLRLTVAACRLGINKFGRLPRGHAFIVAGLSFGLLAITTLPSEKASASRQTRTIELPELTDSVPQSISTPLAAAEKIQPVENRNTVKKEQVQSGDNLSKIFNRAGLSDKAMFELVNSGAEAKKLASLKPGESFSFEISSDGVLLGLTRKMNKLNSEVFLRSEKGFNYKKIVKTPDVQIASRSGHITSSLYNAGIESGLSEQLIMEMAGIFGWDIDFALDLRGGDRFKIVYEELFLEGERLGTGRILAAEFTNQETPFQAVLYTDETGREQYYSPEGKAMRKAFLRAPLDFRRISSNFNPRRLHPITKQVKPHRGTDYAASRGTPVWAAGDGKVIASGYTRANGNYIVIQHGGDIRTKYLHLHKRNVKTGSRVKQKQVIGTVGSTGMSTAPHLHYEFLLSGVHRNPRTIVTKLPKAKSIPETELPKFLAQTQPHMAYLDQHQQKFAGTPDGSNLN